MGKVNLMGISLDNINVKSALMKISYFMDKPGIKKIFFLNADCLYQAQFKKNYAENLGQCDLLLPDGIGLKVSASMHGVKILDNCNGTDLSPKIMEIAKDKELPIFMLGGLPGIADKAAKRFKAMVPGLKIVGCESGYIDDWGPVIERIKKSKAKILFVGFGAPLQEKWIIEKASHFSNMMFLAVGGLFDYYSGKVRRAPSIVRQLNLEWLWRIFQEPKRLYKRYLVDGIYFLRLSWLVSRKKSTSNKSTKT